MKQLRSLACTAALLSCLFSTGALAEEEETESTESQVDLQLETMVVTATKTEHTLEDVPEATTVITREEIEAQNATNALEVLRWIPGVNVSTSFGSMGGDGYTVDGASSSEYTLMLIDGNRVKSDYALSEIPVSSIERIEIVKGANSLLYGSDAMNGIINVITKPAPDTFTASVEGSYSFDDEADTSSQEASIGFKLGELRQLYTYGRRYIEGGDYKSDTFSGKYGYTISENANLDFDIRAGLNELEYSDMDRYDYHLGFTWKPDDLSTLKIKGFFRDYAGTSFVGGADEGTYEDSTYDEEDIEYSRLLWDSHLVTVGYQRMGDTFDYEGPSESWDKSQDSNNVFLQDEISITKTITLVPAIRMDYHSEWDDQVNPKVSMLWRATEDTSLRLSWGTAFKAPSFERMYRTTWHGYGSWGFWILGNADLKPEESETYRISLEQRLGDLFHGSIALFRNDYENMIEGGYIDAAKTQYSYSNVAEAMTQGVEVDMKFYITKEILFTLAYTYLDTEDKETGEELSDTIRHRITPGLRYKNVGLGVVAEVRGEYQEFANTDDGDDDFMLHASLSKTTKIFDRDVKIWLNGDNLLDEEADSGISCAGMTVTAGMRISF